MENMLPPKWSANKFWLLEFLVGCVLFIPAYVLLAPRFAVGYLISRATVRIFGGVGVLLILGLTYALSHPRRTPGESAQALTPADRIWFQVYWVVCVAAAICGLFGAYFGAAFGGMGFQVLPFILVASVSLAVVWLLARLVHAGLRRDSAVAKGALVLGFIQCIPMAVIIVVAFAATFLGQ